MKWVLYNVLFICIYPFLLPGFLLRMLRRGGYAARFLDRLAIYPPEILRRFIPQPPVGKHEGGAALPREPNAPVWIHAVSVGEVQVAGQLMRAWRKIEPSVRFCFSTTSSTGWKTAEREVGPEDVLIYNPLDFPTFVRAALLTVRPRAIILAESEIWPNFIRKAKKYGIPLFVVNARVSDRSAPRYRAARWFFRDVFGCFSRIFAQSDLDKARLVAAGAPAERVEVTGSFKFDVAHRNPAKEQELAQWIFGQTPSQARPKILLGGSTWPGEDKLLLSVYRKLLENNRPQSNNQTTQQSNNSNPPILVLAPRHFEKAGAVEENIRAAGFDCRRRSRPMPAVKQHASTSEHLHPTVPPVFLADTTGELMGLYGIADVVFVGKSVCAHGSQNMIEPCLCGKPTVVGPYTENFRPVMSDLLASRAIVQAPDATTASQALERLMREGDTALGERASAAVESRCGVVDSCVRGIVSSL